MNQVITALIIALSFILIFFWAPILGVVYSGSLESTHPLVMSDNSVNAGYVTGYSAVLGKIRDIELSNSQPEAQMMGAVSFRMSLNFYHGFIKNDMSLDIDKITVVFVSPSGSETLPQKNSRPFTKPGWTVIRKESILPTEHANEDNIIEPYESFEILVFPSKPLSPMSRFIIFIQLPDNNKIYLSRSVPETISSVMNLN